MQKVFLIKLKMMVDLERKMWMPIFLTPKVLLSPVGTIWTLGRLVQFQFMLRFFEIFMEDVVFYKLCMLIIFSKIGHSSKKL